MQWRKACICCDHWPKKKRRNVKHLPSIGIPHTPSTTNSRSTPRRKPPTKRHANRKQLFKKEEKEKEKNEEIRQLQKLVSELQSDQSELKEKVRVLSNDNCSLELEKEKLTEQIEQLHKEKQNAEIEIVKMKTELTSLQFSIDTLSDSKFVYLTGLDRIVFNSIFCCFQPYLHLLKYEGCRKDSDCRRKLSKETELFCVLMICRHSLDFGIVGNFIDVSNSTLSRIFEAWITFGHAIFSKINLSPSHRLIKHLLPEVYKNFEMDHVVLIIDATEFKLSSFSDLQLNSLFFSEYKNTHTAKVLAYVTPHGAVSFVPDLYPGSITDTDITDATGCLNGLLVHDGVTEAPTVLTDKGFF